LIENPEEEKFNEIYQLGIKLARKHHYRFPIHKFEQLVAEVPSEYEMSKCPLEEDKVIQEYVDFLFKR